MNQLQLALKMPDASSECVLSVCFFSKELLSFHILVVHQFNKSTMPKLTKLGSPKRDGAMRGKKRSGEKKKKAASAAVAAAAAEAAAKRAARSKKKSKGESIRDADTQEKAVDRYPSPSNKSSKQKKRKVDDSSTAEVTASPSSSVKSSKKKHSASPSSASKSAATVSPRTQTAERIERRLNLDDEDELQIRDRVQAPSTKKKKPSMKKAAESTSKKSDGRSKKTSKQQEQVKEPHVKAKAGKKQRAQVKSTTKKSERGNSEKKKSVDRPSVVSSKRDGKSEVKIKQEKIHATFDLSDNEVLNSYLKAHYNLSEADLKKLSVHERHAKVYEGMSNKDMAMCYAITFHMHPNAKTIADTNAAFASKVRGKAALLKFVHDNPEM